MFKKFIILTTMLLIYMQVSAQTFSLNDDGIVQCKGVNVGQKGSIFGVEYEAVDRNLLLQRINQRADVTKLCTSLVTNMYRVFYEQLSFNDDIRKWDVADVADMVETVR